jgi:hypothetical protein
MDKKLKEKLLVKNKWQRGLFMLLFLIIKHFVSWLIVLIAILQFIIDLLANEPNDALIEFTKGLNNYLLQVVNFITFNTEIKPFPFGKWPGGKK